MGSHFSRDAYCVCGTKSNLRQYNEMTPGAGLATHENFVVYQCQPVIASLAQVNLTTYEKFRRPYSRPRTRTTECLSPGGNPFDAGFFRNWAEAFFPCFVRPPMCVLASTEEIKDLEAPNMLLRGQQGPMLTSTASWTE
mmetsp:Transcript_31607/g.96739  ORF Transcript_31607/g.96739 Transcript_31607/m.96739 type:complete len:139 (-) Transcript_31607:112-528(-)